MTSSGRYRNYCFTYFPKYESETLSKEEYENWCCCHFSQYVLDEHILLKCKPKYLIWAREYCGSTGRLHFQCFIIWKNARSIEALCKAFKQFAIEWIPCSGSIEDNIRYCKKGLQSKEEWDSLKDKGPNYGKDYLGYESGEPPVGQGTRTDLKSYCDMIKNGDLSVENILLNDPMTYHKYGRTLEKLEDTVKSKQYRKLDKPPYLEWVMGPPGSGKSTYVLETLGLQDDPDVFHWDPDRGFWDRYNGQKTIVFNDYGGESVIPLKQFLKICDRFRTVVSRRCKAPIEIMATKIYVTSTHSPEEVYGEASFSKGSSEEDNLEWRQLERRISKITTLQARDTNKPILAQKLLDGTEVPK